MSVIKKMSVGVSACLLGENVRYDGQHKLDHFIRDTLGEFVEFVPVCPEVECGLSVPREAMRLVGDPEQPRLMTQRSAVDHTERMLTWSEARVQGLAKDDLCGFIFKSRSPSSGMVNVKVYNERGGLSGRAPGLFAKQFMAAFPLLPVEDEGRLHDIDLRENFIVRLFTLKRYRESMRSSATLAGLTRFHATHKLLIMSHSPQAVATMGRLLACAAKDDVEAIARLYEDALLKALKLRATPRKHANVLQHMLGYFKKHLDAGDRAEVVEIIEDYRKGMIPLVVPVTLLRHHVRRHGIAYLADQVYLNPHPLELKLRNHA